MEVTGVAPDAAPPVLFGRPGKKRKIYRQRHDANADTEMQVDSQARDTPDILSPASISGKVAQSSDDVDDANEDESEQDGDGSDDNDRGSSDDDMSRLTVAELIRRRKMRRPRLGVKFREGEGLPPSAARELERQLDEFDLDNLDIDLAGPIDMGARFAPQTGLIGDVVNKHMEEYVEAEMAKRYKKDPSLENSGPNGPGGASDGPGSGLSGLDNKEVRERLAMKGKLHEIDLGAESRARNIAMTEKATRRLRGSAMANDSGEGDGSESSSSRKPPKASDHKGKQKHRNRRGSDDIARDQMVEQFLHENKMDINVYDTSRENANRSTEGRPTDDRVAEQFRREFMEALSQRLRRKRRPLGPPAKPKVRNEEEILRGPKLGGSRNVRSVMRDRLLQKQEEERQSIPKYEKELQEQRRRANRRR